MTQTNKTFYSITNILKWMSIILILIPLAHFIIYIVAISTKNQIDNYNLPIRVLNIIQLIGVVFWCVVNIVITIVVGKSNSPIGSATTRFWLLVALLLVLGPSIFIILLAYNVIPEFNGINYLIMCLPLIEILGVIISLIWSCITRNEMK